MEARLAKIRAKEKSQRDKYFKGDQNFKKRKTESKDDDDDDDAQYILEDYESGDEKSSNSGGASSVFSAATLELMSKAGMGPMTSRDEDEEVEDETKVNSAGSSVAH